MKFNNGEIYKECRNEAIKFISKVRNESPFELEQQLLNDVLLYNSVHHLASMYFEFKTNECLKSKNEQVLMEQKRLRLL